MPCKTRKLRNYMEGNLELSILVELECKKIILFSMNFVDFQDSRSVLPLNVFLKWRKAAFLICGLSIGFEFILGIISLGMFH